jgi:CRP-like cAMP-binding protein|tara:strand:+ start:432 stop:767 length:336 start_codon:yes stop_codon:yes gene_type:complete
MNNKVTYYKDGQTIIAKGEHTYEAYIIDKGSVEVRLNNKTLAILKENEIFGEIGWLGHIPRTATVTALTDVTLRVLPEEQAQLYMQHNPSALIPILKIVVERMSEMLTNFK